MKKVAWMSAVDMAWKKAIEKKTGHEVHPESREDIRVLARIAVKPQSPEVVVYSK